jgi:hypothetical protein
MKYERILDQETEADLQNLAFVYDIIFLIMKVFWGNNILSMYTAII